MMKMLHRMLILCEGVGPNAVLTYAMEWVSVQ
jgi:hypothetical protein